MNNNIINYKYYCRESISTGSLQVVRRLPCKGIPRIRKRLSRVGFRVCVTIYYTKCLCDSLLTWKPYLSKELGETNRT